jgi:hypothetical protein
MLFTNLIIAHVIFTTTGYLGLIVANIWLLLLLRTQQPIVMKEAIRTWRLAAQIFGPVLGIGALLGFGLAGVMHVPLGSSGLIATYALIVLALGVQAAVMIPWQVRANVILTSGGSVPMRPVIVVLTVLSVGYATILSLMVLRQI